MGRPRAKTELGEYARFSGVAARHSAAILADLARLALQMTNDVIVMNSKGPRIAAVTRPLLRAHSASLNAPWLQTSLKYMLEQLPVLQFLHVEEVDAPDKHKTAFQIAQLHEYMLFVNGHPCKVLSKTGLPAVAE